MAGCQRCREREKNKRRKGCTRPTEQRLKSTRRCAYIPMCGGVGDACSVGGVGGSCSVGGVGGACSVGGAVM